MSVISRVGVDLVYENRILHYMGVNQGLFMGIDSRGHVESCKDVIEGLDDREIKASIFFQHFTVLNKDFVQELLNEGRRVGWHAVNTKGSKDFPRVSENMG